MSTSISISQKTKELLDIIRGQQSYNKIVYTMASEKIKQISQGR